MKKLITIILFLGIFWHDATSQEQSIIPPSPVSSQFAKYITHEVSLYNGIPEISIPLYTINLRGISIPISLSYHASGIKFAQNNGLVGVGWVINPGYRISRSICGYPDELFSMPADLLTTLRNHEDQVVSHGGNPSYKLMRDKFLAQFVPNIGYELDWLDGEFDQFVLSAPTWGGEFIISDRTNKTIVTMEESNMVFDYKVGQSICAGSQGIKGFQVIDDKGNKYYYGEYNPQTECINETASAFAGTASTAWGLSEIVTPLGDEIKFKYRMDVAGGESSHIKSFTVSETNPDECRIPTNVSDPIEPNVHSYTTFCTKEIITPYETVVFSYNTMYDSYRGKLNKIEIKSLSDEIIKTIEFSYDENYYHVFLDHITVFDKNHTAGETYTFDYNSKITTDAAYTYDHYGYYLPGDPHQIYHQEFLDDPVVVSDYDANYNSCSYSNRQMSDYLPGLTTSRDPNPDGAPDCFTLRKITYPTGGYTVYTYEPGKYLGVGGLIRNAGIRIQSIESYDLINSEPLVQRYEYGNENGAGRAEFSPLNLEPLFVSEKLGAVFDDKTYPIRLITYSTGMLGEVGQAFDQSGIVKYPTVTERYSSSIGGKGKTVYEYDLGFRYNINPLQDLGNVIPFSHYPNGPLYITNYRMWDKPRLIQKTSYAYNGSQYLPVQEDIFEYEQTYSSFTGLKVEPSATDLDKVLTIVDYNDPYNTYMPKGYFSYETYNITVGKNVLKRKFEYNYLNNNTLINEYNYEYKNLLLSKETVKRSTDDVIESYSTYPLDYPSGTVFIDDLKSKRLISYPVEKVNCLNKGSDRSVLSGIITTYKPGGKGLIDSQLSLETLNPIALSSFKFSNRSAGILPNSGSPSSYSPDTRYAKKTTFDDYDNKGNPLQFQKEDNIPVSYLWGYNQTYPVVKIEGIAYDDINSTVKTNISGRAYTSSSSYASVKVDVDYLKGQLSSLMADKRYMVTLYTYSPLIGLTSQTNPNGVTTYYEYDDFGRLKCLKDDDGRILKTYDYHYKQ